MPQLTEQQATFVQRHLNLQQDNDGPPPVTAEENDRLDALTAEQLVTTDLTQDNSEQVFTTDYMSALKDAEFKGEGNPKLKDLMRVIVKGISGGQRTKVMESLSVIVGVPPTAAKLDVDYGRFLVVRKQQDVHAKAKDDEVPGLNEDKHPEFMASRGQLMFGKVLGDTFGIHEVFAALLSPTGGLVGPGNWLIPGLVDASHLDPDNPIGLHGTVHDAAGYLLNYHDEGPGYNYRDSSFEIFGSDNPMSGQMSGIAYWVAEAGDDYVMRHVDEALLAVEKGLKSVRDAVADKVDALLSIFRSKKDAAALTAETQPGEALDVAQAIADANNKAETSLAEPYETSKMGNMQPKTYNAKDKLDAISNFIWN